MKVQMKFQKILTVATIIVAAISIVYALCFFSGNISDISYYNSTNLDGSRYSEFYEVDDFYNLGQTFVDIMVVLGIVFICAVAFLYITATNKRRKYYVTNYIAVGIAIGISAAVAIVGILFISMLLSSFIYIDWEGEFADVMAWAVNRGTGKQVSQSTTIFLLGYVVYSIVLINCVVWILNLVWKIKLMQGEKALLQGGLVKEVA